ncbi:unnamed protein product, partial [Prunus brigantina]
SNAVGHGQKRWALRDAVGRLEKLGMASLEGGSRSRSWLGRSGKLQPVAIKGMYTTRARSWKIRSGENIVVRIFVWSRQGTGI